MVMKLDTYSESNLTPQQINAPSLHGSRQPLCFFSCDEWARWSVRVAWTVMVISLLIITPTGIRSMPIVQCGSTQDDVERLIKRLASKDKTIRVNAADSLAKLGRKAAGATPALLEP
jgi:hypothetical protein